MDEKTQVKVLEKIQNAIFEAMEDGMTKEEAINVIYNNKFHSTAIKVNNHFFSCLFTLISVLFTPNMST